MPWWLAVVMIAWVAILIVVARDPRIEALDRMKREGRSPEDIVDAAFRMDT